MSTVEKAFLQIFERKNRIIDNVKQQILLFDHQLASKCLIDGFVPPPWLLSSSPSDLNKEDLISGLLLPQSQPSIPFCSLYQQPVVTTDNVHLPPVLCSRVDASDEGLDKFLYGKADELDPSITSPPPDCRDEMASDICLDPCLSLARIQRSKSRQRALEHRNSAKKQCKNSESCDKNCDACNNQNKMSKIASLQSGSMDKMELIRSGDDVVKYKVEKEERGKYRSKGRNEVFYSGRVTRSSSVQPSKSNSGPSRAGNTSHVAKQDEVAPRESICKSGDQHVIHELLESEFVEPVDNTESCLLKNEKSGQCWIQGRGEDICPSRITKSRTVHPPSAGKSFCLAKQDGIFLTESGQQPDAADELLQSVKSVDNAATCVAAKEERDQYQRNERGEYIYSGRVTRSRSSVQSPRSINGLSCADKTSEVENCDDNMLLESISGSKEQPSVVDKLLPLVKPTAISDETCVSRKARDCRNKEKENNVYQGGLRRSRSSSQHHVFVNENLKLDGCPDRSISNDIFKSIQPFGITSEGYELKAISVNQAMENAVVDQNNDCSTKSSADSSAKLFSLDSSNTLENKVTQPKPAASNQFLCAKSSERSKGVGHTEVFGTQVHSLPCIDGSDLAELNQCDAFVADTDADSVELVEASASSASNLYGGHNPSLIKSLNMYERVELEATGKSSQSSSAMKVLLKQLDFDDLGECTVMEASSLILKSENLINSLEKSSVTPLHCAENPDDVTFVHYQEKHHSSHEKQWPEEQEAFYNAEKPSETAFSKTSGGRTSKLNVFSSEKDTPDACMDAVTNSVPGTNDISEQETFMENLSTTFKVSSHALHENSLQNVAGSNTNVDSGIDHLFEKDCGKVTGSNTECSGPVICSSPLIRIADATSNDAIGHSNAAALFEKTKGHSNAALHEETKGHSLKEKLKSIPSENQNEVTMGICIAGDIDSVLDQTHAKSSEKNVAFQSVQQGKRSSSDVEGSWPQKRRKIDDQQSNSLSFSLSLKEEDAMQTSAKFLVEEHNGGKCNKKERGRSENTPSTVMHNQFDVASVSSLPLETDENFDHSVDRTGAIDPSSIMFGSTEKCTADENQIILNVGDKSEFANIEHLAYYERSNKESKCQPGEDSQFSTSLIGSCQPPSDLTRVDQSRPELEGFIIQTDGERICNGGESICFEKLQLPNTTIGRASLLEQLCRSACIHTPLPQFPSTYVLHQANSLYQSVPNGLLECTDLRSTGCFGEETNRGTGLYESVPNELLECSDLRSILPENDDRRSHLNVSTSCFGKEANHASGLYQSVPNGLVERMDLRSTLPENDDRRSHLKISSSCFGEETNHAFLEEGFSDCLPLSSSQLTGNEKNPYLSPVGKFWDRITSSSDSSEKRGSLKPELPCINEENEITDEVVDAFQEGTASKTVTCSAKRKPLTEIRECPNAPSSVSGAEVFNVRDSLDSVNTAYSFIGPEKGTKQKVRKHNATKRRDTNKLKEICSIVSGANSTKRASESLRNRFSKPKLSEKTNPRKGGPSFSQKESKINNIVSNVASFIPIVQQKQAASIATGKRDVKVKALEAAEAAKKLAEQKENERKMKKEALKLERARLELENLRQLELEKKRKEEERKKKEASMAAKKRQREEEERLEKERKRKRLEEARRQQRGPEENLCSKDEKEKKYQAPDERSQTMKLPNSEALKHEKMQKAVGASEGKMSAREFSTVVSSTSDAVKTSMAGEDFNARVISTWDRDNQNAGINIEQSYDISPYKGSDDEEEDDDETEPNRKFVPSWASKNRVALAIVSQQNVNSEAIFPPESFCSISHVLLPRKFQQNGAS